MTITKHGNEPEKSETERNQNEATLVSDTAHYLHGQGARRVIERESKPKAPGQMHKRGPKQKKD